jgi:hypothetical protein
MKKLAQIRERNIVSVQIHLHPPQDHTAAYVVAIEMLTLHTEDTIILDSDQVKCFLMDQWEWTDDFYTSNSGYSDLAFKKIGAPLLDD